MICPKCGYKINYLACIDDFIDGSEYSAKYSGVCSHCKTKYQWWEVFKFSYVDNFEEVE